MSVYVWHDGSSALTPFLSKLNVQHGDLTSDLDEMKAIIHWNGDDRLLNSHKTKVLNHSSYTRRLLSENRIHAILQLHAIHYDRSYRTTSRLLIKQHAEHYLIPVFLMDALATYRLDEESSMSLSHVQLDARKLHEIPVNEKTNLVNRLERYAIRTVYALGLDMACVYIKVPRSGGAVITKIDVDPIQCGQVYERYAEAINGYGNRQWEGESDDRSVVFGMDPEFLLRNVDGKIVPASRYLSAQGGVGYDSSTVLGRKHTHPLAELRPEPSRDLLTLVNNLRRTMWMAATQITDQSLQWIAGGMPIPGLPLGGHLHMSGIRLNSQLVRALDNYLALPLIMIEDTSTRGRRRKYGRLGDVRHPPHGGFEYRTLPSWIVSPRLTKGVLALSRIIVYHYEELSERPLDRSDNLIAYLDGNKHKLEPIVRRLWLQLEGTAGYNEYRMYVEPLKSWMIEQRIWNEQADIRAVWRIPPFH